MAAPTIHPEICVPLDDVSSIDHVIGLCGRLLLDRGDEPTHVIVRLMQRARAAALVSDDRALAVLEAAGFHFEGRMRVKPP